MFTNDEPEEILKFRFLDEEGKFSRESALTALKPPYPLKYYVNVVLILICTTLVILWNYDILVFTQIGFFCNDPLFSHKYNGDTVTPTILGIVVGISLITIYFSIEYIRQGSCKKIFTIQNFPEFYVYIKQHLMGIVLVGLFTEIAKTIVAEHRPHFFDTCKPDTNFNCTNGTYVSSFTCTNTEISYVDLADSSRSFPSGHSSLSWFVSLHCTYLIHQRFPSKKFGLGLKMLLFGLCFAFSLTASLTRITDRRHHWWDVLTGTTIGVVGSIYVIRETHKQRQQLKKELLKVQNYDDCDI